MKRGSPPPLKAGHSRTQTPSLVHDDVKRSLRVIIFLNVIRHRKEREKERRCMQYRQKSANIGQVTNYALFETV